VAQALRWHTASEGSAAVDSRQRAEKQIRLVLVMYRVEVRRRDSDEMVRFRGRAQAIFDYLAAKFADDSEVMALLQEARWELRSEPPSRRGSLRKQAIDGGGQFGDSERLG
jgi:hypothetical protein